MPLLSLKSNWTLMQREISCTRTKLEQLAVFLWVCIGMSKQQEGKAAPPA